MLLQGLDAMSDSVHQLYWSIVTSGIRWKDAKEAGICQNYHADYKLVLGLPRYSWCPRIDDEGRLHVQHNWLVWCRLASDPKDAVAKRVAFFFITTIWGGIGELILLPSYQPALRLKRNANQRKSWNGWGKPEARLLSTGGWGVPWPESAEELVLLQNAAIPVVTVF